jgi:nucleotide-binding universal stress UspA family protein
MSYKSILVHLDSSEHAHPRLELALRLARQFGAHLTGVYAMFTPDPASFYVMAGSSDYYSMHEKRRTERSGALERLFRAELTRAEVPGDWLTTDQDANLAVLALSRCADLVVVGQRDLDDPETFVAEHFAENLVMSAGRPVLLVPCAGTFSTVGTHAMLAWDGSREATRAVHDALPFLRRAKQTTIVTVNGGAAERSDSRIAGSNIAAVLERHGVHAEVKDIAGVHDVPPGELLLSRAADLGVDLMVMGCYGHTRWQELIMGGATRAILKSMTVPVLMSH